MGTRSNIIYEEPTGEVLSMYCHYDGYLDYNGRILLDQYYTRSLKPKRMEIDPERPNEMERHRNLNSYMLGVDPGFIEFIYLWNCKEGKWWVATNVVMNLDNAYNRYVVYHTKFTPLTEMLKELDAA